jgi:predicted alpha/beta-fold hydrolase
MYIRSSDGFQLYYDSIGSGPNILLLHGFGNDHKIWYATSWVDILTPHFNVITMDIRGCGESVKSANSDIYSLEQHCKDIDLLFAKFPHTENYLWGWSLGATISLYYSKTRKIQKTICAGSYFGKIFTMEFVNNSMKTTESPITKARLTALLNWPYTEPRDITNPLFIYSGTMDGNVAKQLEKQKGEIMKSGGRVSIYQDLDHFNLLNKIDIIKPQIFDFLNIK